MSSYERLAPYYDTLTADVDYGAWADYYQRFFDKSALPIHTVLDLACGTGTLTCLMAERGYEMIGIDLSPEMLAEAAEKAQGVLGEKPIFLNQSMSELDLYGTIDACICCLDSVNYVTDPKELRKAFQRVHLFLMAGGLFLFDINSPEKLRGLDGQVFIDERDDLYCIWRAEYSKRRRICTYGFDLFWREGELWSRACEEHEEYVYEPEELEKFLREAGFESVKRLGERTMRAPRPGADRICFCAKKKG